MTYVFLEENFADSSSANSCSCYAFIGFVEFYSRHRISNLNIVIVVTECTKLKRNRIFSSDTLFNWKTDLTPD